MQLRQSIPQCRREAGGSLVGWNRSGNPLAVADRELVQREHAGLCCDRHAPRPAETQLEPDVRNAFMVLADFEDLRGLNEIRRMLASVRSSRTDLL